MRRLGQAARRAGHGGGATCSTCSPSARATCWTRWFESDPIKAALGLDGIVGNIASPYTPGSAYVLLHHVFGEVNGKSGTWGHAIGGMGAITQAMAKAAPRAASTMRTDAAVREVLVRERPRGRRRHRGRARDSGRRSSSPTSTRSCSTQLLSTRRRCRRISCGASRTSVRLRHVPHERGAERAAGLHLPARHGSAAEHHTARHHHRPDLAYIERAYFDAKASPAGRASPSSRC